MQKEQQQQGQQISLSSYDKLYTNFIYSIKTRTTEKPIW